LLGHGRYCEVKVPPAARRVVLKLAPVHCPAFTAIVHR
jgi:hypothetical protein